VRRAAIPCGYLLRRFLRLNCAGICAALKAPRHRVCEVVIPAHAPPRPSRRRRTRARRPAAGPTATRPGNCRAIREFDLRLPANFPGKKRGARSSERRQMMCIL